MSKVSIVAPLALVVSGSIVYHVSAKSIPKAFDPIAAVVGLYATALAGGVLLYAAARARSTAHGLPQFWHPTVAGVGIGALMIEVGFLLAYRGAWPISTVSIIANGLVAVLLVAVGAVWFGESVTAIKLAGVLLCLAGVTLLQR